MKVWIDRDTCESSLSACLSCFGQLLLTGVPDRACIIDFEDDGSEDLTVFMHSEGQDHEPLVIPKNMREMVAYEGWDKFVSFEPRFRKNEGAEHIRQEQEKLTKQVEILVYTFSITGVFIWLAIVSILAATASFLPAWRASRITIREVLAYE